MLLNIPIKLLVPTDLLLFTVLSRFKPNKPFISDQRTQTPKCDVVSKVHTFSKGLIFMGHGAASSNKAYQGKNIFHGGSLTNI